MMWRKVLVGTATLFIPVTITTLDLFGYVAKVEGASMQPVLNPDTEKRDYVYLNKWAAHSYRFERGEIVSLLSPFNPDQTLIKRIIGLEGDVIRPINCKEGSVTIPEGHCWVEGDHHKQSMDSNLFGPVSLALIVAKASHIVWPPHRWQRLKPIHPNLDRYIMQNHTTDDNLF
ncbi:hypothetical protein ACJMK2_016464 [Sinanodonta woodiana]|uniref:Mitochondrial inner membrane protease subunit 2 n=1 Tax=Sinanodonta woodiana TaxID=1069815 RepID=A0ABD3UV04_SINWO